MEGASVNDTENRGMIPRAVLQIFDSTRELENKGWKVRIYISLQCVYYCYYYLEEPSWWYNGLMVSVLTSNVVDCGFDPSSGQTKGYKMGIYSFSAKHATY